MAPRNIFSDIDNSDVIEISRDLEKKKHGYLRPILVKYGYLTIITAGGTAALGEMNPQGNCTGDPKVRC